jgi:hypothetical protein
MRSVANLTLRTLIVAVLAASAAAQADDEFRVQAQLGYDKINFDGPGDEDVDAFALSGTFFFEPVPTAGVPVGEAAYIARSSFANVVGSKIDFGDGDLDVLAANVGYHVPNTIFFGRVGVAQADFDGEDDTSWNGTVGIVPIPRLFFGTDFTEDDYDPNITARYAGKLENDHWWAGSVSAADPDEGDTDVGVEFDYYFPSFKLGGGFNSAGDTWNARLEKGLPGGFALQGELFTGDGTDGFGLVLTWRDL